MTKPDDIPFESSDVQRDINDWYDRHLQKTRRDKALFECAVIAVSEQKLIKGIENLLKSESETL